MYIKAGFVCRFMPFFALPPSAATAATEIWSLQQISNNKPEANITVVACAVYIIQNFGEGTFRFTINCLEQNHVEIFYNLHYFLYRCFR